jgi:hypothetical protein
LCSENSVEALHFVVAWECWEIRLSCCNLHAVWCSVTRVIKSKVTVQIKIVGRI